MLFSRQVMSDSSRPHRLSLSIELVMPSNHFILCCLLLLLPSIFPSIKVFSYESALRIRWQENWSFSVSPSKEYSGLISFKIVWFNFLAFQGILMSLLQHCNSKASVLQHSAFFYGPALTSVHDNWKSHSLDYYGPLSAEWCLCFLHLHKTCYTSWEIS